MSSSNTHNGQTHHHGQLITLLHNLGSKEVECHVQLTVHSVSDLPVKSGRFRVRWKFRDIDAKLARQHRKAAAALKAKEHQTQAVLSPAASQTESQTTTTASSSDTEDKDTLANGHTPKDTNNEQPRPQTTSESPNAVEYSSEDHGQTDYVRMRKRDHSVTYEQTVDVIARMRVYKGELNSEPLKLVVEQLPNDINSESYRGSPLRIGHRYINLAEFVSEGKLRRKYLLESSKTNAMISVSLDITVIKAQAEFTKPVLRQDRILIGRKEPRSVASSTHPTSTTVVLSRPSLDQSSASASTVSSSSSSSRDSAPRPHQATAAPSRSSASTQLSTVNDTEAIIEALFNPPVFNPTTHAASNKAKSNQSMTSGRSVTTTTTTTAEKSIISSLTTPYEYPGSRSSSRARVGTADAGEFGALSHGSADGHSAGIGMETSITRRPSVATTATSASTSSGGWGGDDEQNQNQNQSHRGRLLSKLKKPFSVTRRSMTPTPGTLGSRGELNSSSTSIGGRKRSSLDIVYSAPVPTSEGMKTPTLTADNGVTPIAPAPQAQRQMYHLTTQTATRTLLAVPVHAR